MEIPQLSELQELQRVFGIAPADHLLPAFRTRNWGVAMSVLDPYPTFDSNVMDYLAFSSFGCTRICYVQYRRKRTKRGAARGIKAGCRAEPSYAYVSAIRADLCEGKDYRGYGRPCYADPASSYNKRPIPTSIKRYTAAPEEVSEDEDFPDTGVSRPAVKRLHQCVVSEKGKDISVELSQDTLMYSSNESLYTCDGFQKPCV